MNQNSPTNFGKHLKELRMEQGKQQAPPHTLRRLARALSLPSSELFVAAGILTSEDMPQLDMYLRTRYGEFSDDSVRLVRGQIERLARKGASMESRKSATNNNEEVK